MSKTVLHHIGQLLTMRGNGDGPLCGSEMERAEVLHDAAVVWDEGVIVDIGNSADIVSRHHKAETFIDAGGRMVTPGLIDPHTHLVHAGSREHELELKLQGRPYLEILAQGGGILSTVKATREATLDELTEQASASLRTMLSHGVTMVEAKSGYGLEWETEFKQLAAVQRLQARQPVRLVATFLGAHAIPQAYRNNSDAYIDCVIGWLEQVASNHLAEFCDVFCEQGVFSIEQSRRLLTAAKQVGLGLKIHADEMEPMGGAELAAEVKAVSADHLLAASDEGLLRMKEAGVIAVLLPGTSWNLGKPPARARFMLDEVGLPIALATDYNPGSCPTENLQLVMAFACHLYKLRPLEVFCAVTRNAACALQRGKEAGVIDVGRSADVVLWGASNPAYVLYHFGINHVKSVWVSGQLMAAEGRALC